MTSVVLENKSIEELCDYLFMEITDISEDVLSNLRQHKVDGKIFVQLNEEYLREVAPLLGDRLKLKKGISEALEPQPLPANQYISPNQSGTPLVTPNTSFTGDDDSYIEVN